MQASIGWTRPRGTLGTLIASAHERVEMLRPDAARLAEAAASGPVVPSFAAALGAGKNVTVIAEIKRRSPSKGAIAPGLSATDQARAYASGGAAAISVLTEPTQFGGTLTDLDAALAFRTPLLRKDFIVDRLQLLEAVAHGASAILLIARALPPERLAELYTDARQLGLEALVEVRDEAELAVAIAAEYPVIGVNNRNLETLEIDLETCARLLPMVPASAVAVYESGVQIRSDVERAAGVGADAVLVGSALSSNHDAAAGVRALTGVPRRARHGS